MKNIFLLFLSLPLILYAQKNPKQYYLKAAENTVSNTLIDSAVNILNKRLANQGYNNCSVRYDGISKEFIINAIDFIDTNFIKLWLIKPFKISIYESYTIETVISVLAFGDKDKTALDIKRQFYHLLNIDSHNFETLKRLSHVGMLALKDTALFWKLSKQLKPYLPENLVFAFPQKLTEPNIPAVEIYALKSNESALEVNKLLINASNGKDGAGHPCVRMEFSKTGKKMFAKMTELNTGRPIIIAMDGRVLSAPFVAGKIEGGQVELSGNFNFKEAQDLASTLTAGYLPLNLTFISR